MSKRKLKRQLGLVQIIMLGTAGAMGAEIFVLTGHAAGIAGAAAVLALLVGGLLSYSVALNYCELATTYPVAGGAMSYVREAYGNNILSYLVGSMDCLSSTFYAALSAVGFAYSLQVFIPALPIIPVAIAVILLFVLLNITGVTQVGNIQVLLGIILLAAFVVFIVLGFVRPSGFKWQTLMSGTGVFVHQGTWATTRRILMTIALVYTAYVGFEVIADDAEEVSNPSRTIPRGILISLTLCMLFYVAISLVTLGVVPWQEIARSETALTDAVRRFIPGWGVPMMAVAGIVATLTTINSSMLSATREAFTLSRDGTWPRVMSKLSRFRTPYAAIIIIGAISALVAVIGMVDFLSYISSSGYLFVLFWGSLSMVRLRKRYPDIERPFKAPLFPFTAYAAGATCILIIAFADWRALLFGAAVLAVLAVLYYLRGPVQRWRIAHAKTTVSDKDRILVAAGNPATARRLVHLSSIIAEASDDTYICTLGVAPMAPLLSLDGIRRFKAQQRALLAQIAEEGQERNVALYTKVRHAPSVAQDILEEIDQSDNVMLLLTGWPGPLELRALAENPVKMVLQRARTNVAVFLDRGLDEVQRILVPVGGGPHSRLAIRLAYEIGRAGRAQVVALRVLNGHAQASEDEDEVEDKTALLAEIIEEVLGAVPSFFSLRVAQAKSVPEGVLAQAAAEPYELIVMGASEEWALRTRLFGSVDDWIADKAPCSVLLCRRYEPVAISWLRRQVKRMEREYDQPAQDGPA